MTKPGLVSAVLFAAVCSLSLSQVLADGDTLSVTDFSIALESSGDIISRTEGTFPNLVLRNPQLPENQNLQVTFKVTKGGSATKVQQVMLMLVSQSLQVPVYAIGKLKKDTYTISIGSSSILSQLGAQGGMYTARLLLGDPSVEQGVDWLLGELEVLMSATSPAPTVRTAAQQPLNNLKPEIHHIFRVPDKRAPPAVSVAFTGLALLPLAAAILYVLSGLKVNFKAWPSDGPTAFAALVFHASIAAMLVLYMLFWLKFNLAQTLPLVLVIGAIVALSGYKTLAGVSNARIGKLQKSE